jgi:hypothetical protein
VPRAGAQSSASPPEVSAEPEGAPGRWGRTGARRVRCRAPPVGSGGDGSGAMAMAGRAPAGRPTRARWAGATVASRVVQGEALRAWRLWRQPPGSGRSIDGAEVGGGEPAVGRHGGPSSSMATASRGPGPPSPSGQDGVEVARARLCLRGAGFREARSTGTDRPGCLDPHPQAGRLWPPLPRRREGLTQRPTPSRPGRRARAISTRESPEIETRRSPERQETPARSPDSVPGQRAGDPGAGGDHRVAQATGGVGDRTGDRRDDRAVVLAGPGHETWSPPAERESDSRPKQGPVAGTVGLVLLGPAAGAQGRPLAGGCRPSRAGLTLVVSAPTRLPRANDRRVRRLLREPAHSCPAHSCPAPCALRPAPCALRPAPCTRRRSLARSGRCGLGGRASRPVGECVGGSCCSPRLIVSIGLRHAGSGPQARPAVGDEEREIRPGGGLELKARGSRHPARRRGGGRYPRWPEPWLWRAGGGRPMRPGLGWEAPRNGPPGGSIRCSTWNMGRFPEDPPARLGDWLTRTFVATGARGTPSRESVRGALGPPQLPPVGPAARTGCRVPSSGREKWTMSSWVRRWR